MSRCTVNCRDEITPGRAQAEETEVNLLRLMELVSQIAHKLDIPCAQTRSGSGDAFQFNIRHASADNDHSERDLPIKGKNNRLAFNSRPPLPDPELVRKIIRQRQLRARYFDSEIFADPAWDMLLDLTASRVEHVRVSVTSLCMASGVPMTTSLRWIERMIDAGLIKRVDDETDRRRVFITMTDKAVEAIALYFSDFRNNNLNFLF